MEKIEIQKLDWNGVEDDNAPGLWHGVIECERCGECNFALQWHGGGTLYAYCLNCNNIQGVACE